MTFTLLAFLNIGVVQSNVDNSRRRRFSPAHLAAMLALSLTMDVSTLTMNVSFAYVNVGALRLLNFPLFTVKLTSFILTLVKYFVKDLMNDGLQFPMRPVNKLMLVILTFGVLDRRLV